MDEFPHRARRGKPGKLLEVLRHRLRGIQGDESNIADSYAERGLPVPAHIAEPPSVKRELALYWTAYADLQHERPLAMTGGIRRIPWSAIAHYARHHDINVDELKRYIWALDTEFIEGTRAPDAAPEQTPDEDTAHG